MRDAGRPRRMFLSFSHPNEENIDAAGSAAYPLKFLDSGLQLSVAACTRFRGPEHKRSQECFENSRA
jgi:hypothetical protein